MNINTNPMQPYFQQYVTNYQELHSNLPGISLFFMFHTTDTQTYVPIIPDNCMDIMFCKTGDQIRVYYCGTVLKMTMYDLLPNSDYFCVRFHMQILDTIVDVPAKDCISVDIVKDDVESFEIQLGNQLFSEFSFEKRIQIFENSFKNCYKIGTNSILINNIINAILNSNGNITIKELSDQMHYSYNYIYSQFMKYVGISPKLYCRITRFQYIIQEMMASPDTSAPSGEEFGFYDQSHFYNEIKKFSGITPLELIALKNRPCNA